MSSELTREERDARVAAQPPQDPAQPRKAAPANKWAQDAMHPEKALFRTWALVAIGIAIRVIMPLIAGNGIMIIPGFAVLAVLFLPPVMVGTTLYYNKNIKDSGKAWLLGSAAVAVGFGIYLLTWAMS
jgi:hypothetical protein